MTPNESEAAVTLLFAAYPDRHRSHDTKEVYARHLQRLASYERTATVIDGLVSHSSWLPPISVIEEAYRAHIRSHPQPALPEPELTEAERREGLRRIRALTEMLEGHIDLDEALKEVASEAMHVVRDPDRTGPEDVRGTHGRRETDS